MNKIKDGGPAFPRNYRQMGYAGLSRRDYFAAQALPALIARHRADVPWGQVAPLAYGIADAMIAASTEGGDADG